MLDVVESLATSFTTGEQTVDAVVARAGLMLGRPWKWLRPLASRYLNAFSTGVRPRHRDVVEFLLGDEGFLAASKRHQRQLRVAQALAGPDVMRPAAEGWDVPSIESVGALAEWLSVHRTELEWFADLRGLNRPGPLSHYQYRVLAKQVGAVRLIEAPKPKLKEMQRRILTEILDCVPAHPAVHGFVRGRSIRTFAAPHSGHRVVVRLDLEDFFPSIIGARVQALFRTFGYPECVADLLGGICTNSAPSGAFGNVGVDRQTCDLYRRPHLPQGAPTSPAIANLCAYRADCRLVGLADAADARYTRYADDLAFSGGAAFEGVAERFCIHAAAILSEEGFQVHHRKTRIMRHGVRQHLAGLVVNRRINVYRDDFDRLKAILTNCLRHGPETQNRENHPSFRAHLEGRISFVAMIHPERGQRLRRIFDQVGWDG